MYRPMPGIYRYEVFAAIPVYRVWISFVKILSEKRSRRVLYKHSK